MSENIIEQSPQQKKPHTLQAENCNKLNISGVSEVLGATETAVCLLTSCGILDIAGQNIKIKKYNAEEGGISLVGEFISFKYSQSKSPAGFFKRLFK